MTQLVVIQMRQVYFWNNFISRSYCRKMLMFIKAFTNSFLALNEVHQFLSKRRSALVQLEVALPHNQERVINIVKTFWYFDHVLVRWNTPELRTKTSEVLDQGCGLFSKPRTRSAGSSAWQELKFQMKKAMRWKFIHIALLSEMITSDIKLSWWFCHS